MVDITDIWFCGMARRLLGMLITVSREVRVRKGAQYKIGGKPVRTIYWDSGISGGQFVKILF